MPKATRTVVILSISNQQVAQLVLYGHIIKFLIGLPTSQLSEAYKQLLPQKQ